MREIQTTDAARAKAETAFKRKEAQAREGAIAMKEYLAAQVATRERMERLRALRLSKEAAEAQAAGKKTAAKA
ncbi:hypothetical protein DW352_08010 [Pseudolabrys taiwanensis]|uniref:Uncharacterized protein n=1 Tax=Pseudolabrys taiwanensis TaxID=331696 RepID=A0A345ZU65_9HYPH|nr:hypothetical protein [Pseudolabrys taiwanensis]AXK80462.1 hypothetical protein DW352_08010 [Pseudolabrys taiwanensis]